jgi:hypothetical protein
MAAQATLAPSNMSSVTSVIARTGDDGVVGGEAGDEGGAGDRGVAGGGVGVGDGKDGGEC